MDDIYELSVENVKRGAGIQLPFTGGPGTVLFIVAGVLLVAGATALTVRYIRR
ncbi:LPXTG cell wall anchor domain-containing protein [Actinomycetaceae bacterium WB03_NA08]|uniref:LPXTG cell wall anchor domain-containing protein n=1 Tax=Scrofimicrobium canadense TaxID=2652290 RepID=A0A6N7W2R7_9ACTO|nr:LPXTG cell wall anchor domain-containing protein [Scrofimicrobium canadense]MSS83691.1 LPXTG cell wall anchor domain-containing protein [Scrofimicrobium canadense]